MRVLIISDNRFGDPTPAFPTGPAYIAGGAREAGHEVEVFDCLFSEDMDRELGAVIEDFSPHVVGVSIRSVNAVLEGSGGELKSRHVDLRPNVRSIVDSVKRTSDSPIVLGGCGFNYFGEDWLEYLGLEYGIRGESGLTFPLYLERLEDGGDVYDIPGCIFRKDGEIHGIPRRLVGNLDKTPFPAIEFFDLDRYREIGTVPGIFTKRGCRFRCAFCPYSELEGTRYRLKTPSRVVDEMERAMEASGADSFQFCDNLFNFPKHHAESICRSLTERDMGAKWTTGVTPLGLDEEFCGLLRRSGCEIVNLDAEFATDEMLRRMHRGYGVDRVREAILNLDRAGLPFTMSLLIGGPGETPQTVTETFELIDDLPKPVLLFVTIGIAIWTGHQRLITDARKDGQVTEDASLFDGAFYISPELPRDFMEEFVISLEAREECRYAINKAYADEDIEMRLWE